MTEERSHPIPRDPDAPFALQLEWLVNRYNPGYFLGGTIRPELHAAALGSHAKRVAGALAFFAGVASLAPSVLLLAIARMPPDPWSLGFGLLNTLAGVRLWKAAALQASSAGKGDRAEGSKALRVAVMVVLGVVVMAAISIAIVTAVVTAVLVARGNAGSIAAIAVLIAVVTLRRAAERSGDS